MALLFMDGFSGGDYTTKWETVSGIWSRNTTNPRIAGATYLGTSSSANLTKRFTAIAEVYAGMGFNSNGDMLWTFLGDTGVTTHLTFQYNSTSRVMSVYRGTTAGTLLATGTTTITNSTWHYLEMHVLISSTVGIAQVRIDGVTTNDINFSGNTKNGGTNTSVDAFRIGSGGTTYLITDVYLCDTTGSSNNSWLGDVTVRTLTPNGNGAFSQLLGSDSDSVNNYLLVNEQPVSGTQYTGSPTTGQHDSYTMTDLPVGVTTVRGVQLNTYMAKSDATAASGKPMLRVAGTNYYGATRTLGTSYQTYMDLYDTNPNTSVNWTVSDVNGIETGMEVG